MPLRRAACWGSVRRVPLWPRREAVGAPKKGLRARCWGILLMNRKLLENGLCLGTHGNVDGFMVAASYGTPSPVVEALDSGAGDFFWDMGVLKVVDP